MKRDVNYTGAIGEQKTKVVDFNSMTKDELLDYTAQNNIEADYTMTKKEIKNKIQGEN